MLTIGIWMSGRMSVGLVRMETTPAMRIRKEMITKVYGLRSANLTSHMNVAPYITLRSALPQNDSCRSDHQDGNHERQDGGIDRSEERRVGKECRSRWSPY